MRPPVVPDHASIKHQALLQVIGTVSIAEFLVVVNTLSATLERFCGRTVPIRFHISTVLRSCHCWRSSPSCPSVSQELERAYQTDYYGTPIQRTQDRTFPVRPTSRFQRNQAGCPRR